MENSKTIVTLKVGIICLIFLWHFTLISCNSKIANMKITMDYYGIDKNDPYSDTLFIEKTNDIERIRFLSNHNNDTTFIIQRKDSAIYLKDVKMKITHNLMSSDKIQSNLQAEYFTPYFTNSSHLDSIKVFDIDGRQLKVYRFIENQFDEYPCYSYYLKEIGFIAFANIKAEYYSYISNIENSLEISKDDTKKLIDMLINDSIFFIKDWRIIKIPPPPIPTTPQSLRLGGINRNQPSD
ncbi:MAG: hypothetical protein V4683_17080 [Bacteroidota bacterium]